MPSCDTSGRPSLAINGAWRLDELEHGGYVVIPFDAPPIFHTTRARLSFILGHSEITMHYLAHLKLQLDTPHSPDSHMHDLYKTHCDSPDTVVIPNRQTEDELVKLCKALGEKLVSLSISMCKPELMIPHIPCFVLEIVSRCSRLRIFGLEDIQCIDFNYGKMGDRVISNLVTITRRNMSQSLGWQQKNSASLHTLVVNKRSAPPLTKDMLPDRLPESPDATYPLYAVQINGVRSSELARSMRKEARDLAGLMMRTLPSLARAYVMLNDDAVDLRMDLSERYEPVYAGEAHLAPLEDPLGRMGDTAGAQYETLAFEPAFEVEEAVWSSSGTSG